MAYVLFRWEGTKDLAKALMTASHFTTRGIFRELMAVRTRLDIDLFGSGLACFTVGRG